MFKFLPTASLWVMIFFFSSAQVWSVDMEDRFLNPDFATSKNIFIDVKNVSLVNVLKIISQQTGLSFIASQDVADKQLTLYLNNVPLNQALQMLLDTNGMTYVMQKDSNIFVIEKKPETANNLITKVYQLKYATVSSSLLNSTISIGSTGASSPTSSSSSGSSSSSSSGSSGSSSSGSGSSSAAGSENSSSSGLEAVLKDSLSPDGKVVEDARTNSLIITDRPAQFEIIDNTVAKLDVPIPQVLIEVEMVDISKSTADQLGISYGASPINFTGGLYPTNFPFGPKVNSNATTSSSSSSSSSSVTAGWNANGLTAALNFIATKTDGRVLARPRILTLNNQTAEIQISTDQAIDVVPASSSSGTAGSTQTFTVDRTNTGVILKVTPQANLMTREIIMAVSPRVIDLVASAVVPPSGGTIFDPQTRGSDSILMLKDGQSMVIGGLMNSNSNSTVQKLPFLGDLPFIGAAFRSTQKSRTESELIIFLTPRIIDDGSHMAISNNSSITPQEATDIEDASNRAQAIGDSLNTYEK